MTIADKIATTIVIACAILVVPLMIALVIHHEGDPLCPLFEGEKAVKRDRVSARRWWMRLLCLLVGAGTVACAISAAH